MSATAAILALADGSLFSGHAIGHTGHSVGEVVFNTAMTGYQEILSDPSYCKQHITLTTPHIGNVGANSRDHESRAIFASGLIVRDLSLCASNYRSEQSLSDYLLAHKVVAIAGIDTRRLTRLLRETGAQVGTIMAGEVDAAWAVEQARAFGSMSGRDLAREVSCQNSYEWREGYGTRAVPFAARHVVAYDFGVKHTILRMLVERGCRVTVVPATTPVAQVLAMQPDGVFLSNGPGDPESCTYAIEAIRQLLTQRVPLFGICLGHQLLGLACGARTSKMKFGHHGANHPVQDLETGRVMITSQNHGFQLDEASLPAQVQVTHRSLFDGSVQGIALVDQIAFGFQGHPEAAPGPQEMACLFDRFTVAIDQVRARAGLEA